MEKEEVNQHQKADSAIQHFKLKDWKEKWTMAFMNYLNTWSDNPTRMGLEDLL